MSLLYPVAKWTGISSWSAHQRRSPRSTEPGTDFYCPIGTLVFSPEAGTIYGYGDSIGPATGRWVGVDFDNGMRFRTLHLSRVLRKSGRVLKGELLGISGASGYGDEDWSWNPNTGGAHTHVTLWPTHESKYGYRKVDGKDVPYTIDFMNYVVGTSGGGTTPTEPPIIIPEDVDMIPLYITDDCDGNGHPGWALFNTRTGKWVPLINDGKASTQENANSWSRVLGRSAQFCTRQDALNVADGIRRTA